MCLQKPRLKNDSDIVDLNPVVEQKKEQKKQLLKKLKQLLEVGFNVILCGDFNIVTEERDRIAATPFKATREGKLLAHVCADVSLRDLYRILNPLKVHSQGQTRIDRIYISSQTQALRYGTFYRTFLIIW